MQFWYNNFSANCTVQYSDLHLSRNSNLRNMKAFRTLIVVIMAAIFVAGGVSAKPANPSSWQLENDGKISKGQLKSLNLVIVGEADGKVFYRDESAPVNGTSFINAMENCQKLNLFPATITSMAQNEAIRVTLTQNDVPYWLGLTDLGSEGKFRWVRTGAEVSFNSWRPGHPAQSSESGRLSRNCASIMARTDNVDQTWLNIPCAQENLLYRPLCEFP